MRKLRIADVDVDKSELRCQAEDPEEQFVLPVDDELRAKLRELDPEPAPGADAGPDSPTGTGADDGGSPKTSAGSSSRKKKDSDEDGRPGGSSGSGIRLRPREIQERIRHGASPEEVAADAGVPTSRIEGFSYPVLLERYTAANNARSAHPMMPDGPSLDTLEDKLEELLSGRGVEADDIEWDAWLNRDEQWIVRTTWPSGLSQGHATWLLVPDSHGGSARPYDEDARALLDPPPPELPEEPPAPARPNLRSIPVPVQDPAAGDAPARPAQGDAGQGPGEPVDLGYDPAELGAPRGGRWEQDAPEPFAPVSSHEPRTPSTWATGLESPVPPEQGTPGEQEPDRPAADEPSRTLPPSSPWARTGPGPFDAQQPPQQSADPQHSAPAADRSATPPEGSRDDEDEDFLLHPPADPPSRKSSRRHPSMPSWEDVLLGVRSKDT